ncbi:MAG: type II toxin-antitoxin system PemK/MazF family toxin [Chloroflexota bacterium]
MAKYKVVLVPFPFDDLSSSKVRPAVCLTEPIGQYRHVVLAFITSKIPEELLDSDILIATDDEGFEASGLRVSSTVRLHRMMTATVNIIQRELGQLSEEKQEIIRSRLKVLFSLAE